MATYETILTIDPGLANVGWAVMRGVDMILGYGMITTTSNLPLVSRLKVIREKLVKVQQKYSCEVVVMEDFHGAMAMQNRKVAMDVAKAHGAIQTLPGRIILISPVSVERNKKRDREDKKLRVVKRINERFGLKLPNSYHHVADAIQQGEYYYGKAW